MLVVSRKAGQRFYIGDDIEVLIVDVRGDKVRVGINAPKGVCILREELKDKQEEEESTKSEKE